MTPEERIKHALGLLESLQEDLANMLTDMEDLPGDINDLYTRARAAGEGLVPTVKAILMEMYGAIRLKEDS